MNRDPTSFLGEEYRALVQSDLDWKIRTLQGPSTPWCHIDGKKVLMFCSNNYLGLTNHPALKKSAIDAVTTHGAGSGSVRAIAGNMDIHIELEERLAHFKRAEASLVYQTGYAANSGLIPQLVGEQDLVVSDELNHGSIIDGVRLLARREGRLQARRHDRPPRVLEETERHSPQYRRILVITDGVFSMDGDIAPLDKIAEAGRGARGDDLRRRRSWGRSAGRGWAGHRLSLRPRQEAGPGRDGDILQGIRRRRGPHLRVARPDELRLQQVRHLAAQRVASSRGGCGVHRGHQRSWRTSQSAWRRSGGTRGTSRRG